MEFKNDEARETYEQLDERLKDVAYEMSVWCRENNLPFVITRCVGPRSKTSVTDIHADKRAFDSSVRGWSIDCCHKFADTFNEKFAKEIGAIAKSTHEPILVVYHNSGEGWHLHNQVRKL